MTDAYRKRARELFAEELNKNDKVKFMAECVVDGTDNSFGGKAAVDVLAKSLEQLDMMYGFAIQTSPAPGDLFLINKAREFLGPEISNREVMTDDEPRAVRNPDGASTGGPV